MSLTLNEAKRVHIFNIRYLVTKYHCDIQNIYYDLFINALVTTLKMHQTIPFSFFLFLKNSSLSILFRYSGMFYFLYLTRTFQRGHKEFTPDGLIYFQSILFLLQWRFSIIFIIKIIQTKQSSYFYLVLSISKFYSAC